MKARSSQPPVVVKTLTPEQTLRRLFLTVFLRGQSARGLTKENAPKSVASKMGLMLAIYAGMGAFMTIFAIGQPVLVLSVILHAMTFMMLGMLIATSAGETLFNKEESEILMHRPVTPKMLLRAKAIVLIQITLYMAAAMNLIGLVIGVFASDGGWLYPIAHIISTIAEAFFCTGLIILAYQLCLRLIGREKLESVMTTLQVLVMISITIGSQILPRAIGVRDLQTHVNLDSWWIKLLPPAWFASFDDALAGSGSTNSWALALIGFAITGVVLWLAFGKLADVYQSGVQSLNEATRPEPKQRTQHRFAKRISESRWLRPFLRNSVSQASFQLVAAYMFRDRDTKLRLFPGIAPMLIMPVMMLFTSRSFNSPSRYPSELARHSEFASKAGDGFATFAVALAASYICIIPLMALNLLKYSQQWRASEVFVAAPLEGPAPILQGARTAVMFYLCLPLIVALSIIMVIMRGPSALMLILAGAIATPVYALLPGLTGNATPLSNPLEESKKAAAFPLMMLSMFGSFGVAGAATFASSLGFLWLFLIIEAIISIVLCTFLKAIEARARWPKFD